MLDIILWIPPPPLESWDFFPQFCCCASYVASIGFNLCIYDHIVVYLHDNFICYHKKCMHIFFIPLKAWNYIDIYIYTIYSDLHHWIAKEMPLPNWSLHNERPYSILYMLTNAVKLCPPTSSPFLTKKRMKQKQTNKAIFLIFFEDVESNWKLYTICFCMEQPWCPWSVNEWQYTPLSSFLLTYSLLLPSVLTMSHNESLPLCMIDQNTKQKCIVTFDFEEDAHVPYCQEYHKKTFLQVL